MKKGDIVEGRIEKVNFPNKGILRTAEGIAVVVKDTLPGQRVAARITKKRQGRAEGRLLEVLEKAPDEVTAPCPHFGRCGGCAYLNLPYEKTLALKAAQVYALLEGAVRECKAQDIVRENERQSAVRECGEQGAGTEMAEAAAAPEMPEADAATATPEMMTEVCPEQMQGGEAMRETAPWFEGIKASPQFFSYRNKMEFTFGDETKGGPLALGMHKKGSFYDIVTVEDCRIMDEDCRRILRAVREYFAPLYFPENEGAGERVTFYHRLSHQGYLRHLLLRKASLTGEILIDLVTTSQESHDLSPFAETLLRLPLQGKIAGILHTTNDAVADMIRDDGTEILYGQDWFSEQLLGLLFKITPFSFFQTNSYGAEVLYETARAFLRDCGELREGQKPLVFDLYSGTGTIAQLMAPAARQVIGVEIVEEAVEAARENAARNGLTNCQFLAGDVLKVLDTIAERPDVIVLDPPRDGVHPKALPKILAYGVKHILYISCKPTSLARDLAAFYEAGYALQRAVCVDQFPWTSGVESICLLSKVKTDKHIEVKLKMDELDSHSVHRRKKS